MKIVIQSLHFKAAEHLKDYIQQKCDRLDRYFDRIVDGEVSLRVLAEEPEKNKQVEIRINVPGQVLMISVQGQTFEEATDIATDKLKVQLTRYKEKQQDAA
jgi:putative sigma-54 modulation protein